MELRINWSPPSQKIIHHHKNAELKQKKSRATYIKNLETKNEDLGMMLLEKISSTTMQLNIIMAMLATQSAGKKNEEKYEQVGLVVDKESSNQTKILEQNNSWQQQSKQNIQTEQQQKQTSSKISTEQNQFSPQTTGSSFSPSTPSRLSSTQTQLLKLQLLSQTIRNIQAKLGQQLIQQQVRLQQEYQQCQVLAVFQDKIGGLGELLVVKENDMVNEHTGGNYEDKMKMKTFRAFEERCVEIGNIKAMGTKIMQLKKEVEDIQKNSPQSNTQILSQIQNIDKDQQFHFQNDRVYQGKQNILQIVLTRQSHNTYSPKKQPNIFADPFFRRILRIVKKQLATEIALKKQYRQTQKKLKQINKQHNRLSISYKKIKKSGIGSQKKRNQL